MKVFVRGHGEVTLTQSHYVAAGGQASVYVRNGVAYKIYTDPKDAISPSKFAALSAITDPCVIKPEDLVLGPGGKETLGYTMRAISDNYSLCQLFTRAFRDRNNIGTDRVISLAGKLRSHLMNIHQAGALVVDLNELNILVSKSFDETYLIDVDSYQTAGFPATVIMPSVRDYSVRAADFSALSDWFSYGVLAFQLFIGSHPYKGTHAPSAAVDKDHRLEHRMKNRISAFQSDVSLPKCCYPFDVIPQQFRDWMRAVLQDGKRLPPPDPQGSPIVAAVVSAVAAVAASGGQITISDDTSFEEGWTVEAVAESGQRLLVLLSNRSASQVVLDGRTVYSGPRLTGKTFLGFTPKMDTPVGLQLDGGKLAVFDFSKRVRQSLPFRCDELAKGGDRFYVRNGTRVLEVDFSESLAGLLVTASHAVADVLENASHLWEGAAIQDMIGSVFVSLFPKSRYGYQVRVPELDRYRVVDAKFDGGVLMVVGANHGKYDRLVFRFDDDFGTYDVRVVGDITPSGLNFLTLPSRVCVCMTEDEEIEAFSAKPGTHMTKVVRDAALGNDMRLLPRGGKVGFARGNKIQRIAIR